MIPISDDGDDLLAAFEQTFANDSTLKTAASPKNRKAAEKRHARNPLDGRSKRATGRTAQLNLKIRPESKDRMVAAAKTNDVLIAELAERGFDLVLEELAAAGSKEKWLAAIRSKGKKR